MIKLGPALGGSTLIPCLSACLAAAGRPRDQAVVAGFAGHPFETSYAPGGAELWSCCDLEWSQFAWAGRLGFRYEVFDLVGNNPALRPRPTPEERAEVLSDAFEAIARSTERSIPALVWSPMSAAQKAKGVGAFCWGLVEGVDRASREYLVVHRDAGRFRTPADGLGEVDPVQWFHARVFAEADPGHDEARAFRGALRDGARLLSGELAGATMPAPPGQIRHGTAALTEWAGEVEAGRGTAARSGFWANARFCAAAFCREAVTAVPGERANLETAAGAFTAQAESFRALAAGKPDAALIRKAADLQEAARAALLRVHAGDED